MSSDLAAVVMAGGLGTRMKSSVPKHLHPLLGRRVVDWVLETARATGADPIVVVASPDTRDEYDDGVVSRRAGTRARDRRRRRVRAASA